MEQARFAGGCFWCLEALFSRLRGVRSVRSGYCGGELANPTYQQVCGGHTGHAETVEITFDPTEISYATLLEVFFASHDPTTRNRQGHDIGPQYRSAIFCLNAAQREAAANAVRQLERTGAFSAPIVTEINPEGIFYPAETEHQQYFSQHSQAPYCQAVIAPKIRQLLQQFGTLMQS